MAEAQSRIGLQPASVELEMDPGQPMRQVVTVANMDTARPVSVSLSLADWSFDAAGAPVFVAAGETDTSATGWARYGAPTISLAPGQSKQVVVSLSTPQQPTSATEQRAKQFAALAQGAAQDAPSSGI